jgi:2-polyprenyl-3-methyl-5-hydroxy-6-metoxy-1,4-benzoquinol methylase
MKEGGVSRSRPRDHYSYTVYADPATAQSFDDRRFGGPIGELVASEQARVLMGFVGEIRGRPVLDVGTGTGRAAMLMARAGASVTGIDASDEMLSIARRRANNESLMVTFSIGDVHDLGFENRAFDVAISLRVLMHAADWRKSVAELCRVSDRLVIFDYPSAMSFAALQAAVRRLTHALGVRTEPYRVLSRHAVTRQLDKSGFRIRSIHRQFFLPIAFHKAIGSQRFTAVLEGIFQKLGLVRLFGTPVTLVAERCN